LQGRNPAKEGQPRGSTDLSASTPEQLAAAESVWTKAWVFVIRPLLAVIVGLVCWFATGSISSTNSKLDAMVALQQKQGETITDINGKINYGVIQRINSLETRTSDLESRMRESERAQGSRR
jgi:hypothetical protein